MEKQSIFDYLDRKSPVLFELSDRIWEFAELSMAEFRSAEYYCDLMEREGFTVEKNLCGIPTAFSGRFGEGRPVIGILGEFDALSGLSQTAGATIRQGSGGCGHGCGHNLLGAASLGAAMAIKHEIAQGRLSGTVVFYGCPGEEGCAGKTFMARDGMFRDLDAALCWHPGDVNEITTGSNAACLQVEYTFTGTAAHAAGNPWTGRSALDAAELMNVGVQFLREHMPPRSSVHYAFADAGGISPNVVQPVAKVIYMVRGETVQKAKALLKRVDNIARGAALMTDCQVTSRQIDGTASTVSNTVLEEVLYSNLRTVPLPAYSEDDIVFAKALRSTYDCSGLPGSRVGEDHRVKAYIAEKTAGGTAPLNDFVVPYAPSSTFSPGSTDVGDVSWLTPTAQFTAVTWPSAIPGHSWQVVSAGKSAIAHKGLLLAARVLAGTAADLMSEPKLLEKARKEFTLATAEGYDCPIGPEVKPSVE